MLEYVLQSIGPNAQSRWQWRLSKNGVVIIRSGSYNECHDRAMKELRAAGGGNYVERGDHTNEEETCRQFVS